MSKWVVGRSEVIGVDLGKDDVYGKDSTFNVIVANPKAGIEDKFEGVMTEVVVEVDALSSKASGDTPVGSTKITVDDATNWKKGFVAKVDGKDIYFYVEDVDTTNNILYARKPISDSIADGDTINRVGNTGVYKMEYTPKSIGKYLVVINNPSIDLLNISKAVECVAHDEDMIYDAIKSVENKIDNFTGSVVGEILV